MTDEERKKIEDATAAKKAADDVLLGLEEKKERLDRAIADADEKRADANMALRSILREVTGVSPY